MSVLIMFLYRPQTQYIKVLLCRISIIVLSFGCSLARQTSLSKLENILELVLRFVLDDYQSGYTDLLQNANVPGIKIMVLRYLAIEMFKCIKGINLTYLNAMFTRKEMSLCIERQLNIGETESETDPIRS